MLIEAVGAVATSAGIRRATGRLRRAAAASEDADAGIRRATGQCHTAGLRRASAVSEDAEGGWLRVKDRRHAGSRRATGQCYAAAGRRAPAASEDADGGWWPGRGLGRRRHRMAVEAEVRGLQPPFSPIFL